jgi:hypothetical protein
MDSTVWRVERLDVVEVVWNSSHLYHPVPIICCQALDFRTTKEYQYLVYPLWWS